LKLNKEDLLADVDTLFAQIVDPYVDATSSRGMKEYFIDQLIQQGYLSEEITDAEAYRIFTQQQELLFKAMWADESTVSTDKWMQSYIKNSNYQDYLPYHRILRPDGALYKDGLTLAGVNQELAKLNDELMPEPEKIHKDIAAPLWNIVSTADGQIVAEDLTEQNARDVYQDKYASVIISQPDGSSLQFASRDAAYEY